MVACIRPGNSTFRTAPSLGNFNDCSCLQPACVVGGDRRNLVISEDSPRQVGADVKKKELQG